MKSAGGISLQATLCGALGEIGEGGVLVEDHSLW